MIDRCATVTHAFGRRSGAVVRSGSRRSRDEIRLGRDMEHRMNALDRMAGAIGWVLGLGAAIGLMGLAWLGRRRRKVERPAGEVAALTSAPVGTAAVPAAAPAAEAQAHPSSPDAVPPVPPDEDPSATAKLDLGPAPRIEPPVEHVPWSYGVDRVTAAAIDPARLFVYWEVTDEAISLARARLGAAGPGGWLALRVYDTTGLLFDGNNAHGWFDQGVGRSDRQWFFSIGKPTSTAVVEIGVRAEDGGFARIARSGRVDFPRAAPAAARDAEWMTVVTSAGPVEPPRRGARGAGGAAAGEGPPAAAGTGPAPAPEEAGAFTPIPLWVLHAAPGARESQWRELPGGGRERVTWHEVVREGWIELRGEIQWRGPVTESHWEEGPFPDPVEVLEPEQEEWQGHSFAYDVEGVKHVVFGPWEVVIRNLGVQVSRAVLARWQIYRSWVAEAGREVTTADAARPAAGARPGGASELVAIGASERQWLGASELRLGGASELWRIGASELRLRGASERLMAGASERSLQGASERLRPGASERLLQGASERLRQGASEHQLAAAAPGAPSPAALAPSTYPSTD